jgi:transposase
MKILIKGIKGKDFEVNQNDSLCIKILMLFEGHCTIGVHEATKKYGYTEQRYYQLLDKYQKEGAQGLIDRKPGSVKRPIRTMELINQIIRQRFLDPFASASVLAQKLTQTGYKVSQRSVERTITEYGLKKNACSEPKKREETKRYRDSNIKT